MYVLAFDTANEVIAIGVGRLIPHSRTIDIIAHVEEHAHRASNTKLLPLIDGLLHTINVRRSELACICVGRGPGSFTGVRIALATAKGIARALEVPLVGVSTLDSIAWGAQETDMHGHLLILGDAMRKEVYPAWFEVTDHDIRRLTSDSVIKADAFAKEMQVNGSPLGDGFAERVLIHTQCPANIPCESGLSERLNIPPVGEPYDLSSSNAPIYLAGDALLKYAELFSWMGEVLPESTWTPTGTGLLRALQAAWRAGEVDPYDVGRHDPGALLPVYTRLSDAEENERKRLASDEPKNLHAGVQDTRATMHATSRVGTFLKTNEMTYVPLDHAHVEEVAHLESLLMGTDAWSASLVADELPRTDRTWWRAVSPEGVTLGYAGGLIIDGDVQILKVAVEPHQQRKGIARELVAHICEDARNLGASTASLEVRMSNNAAIAFYEAIGFSRVGVRPRYYSDGEDALIMQASLDTLRERNTAQAQSKTDMTQIRSANHSQIKPLVLAFESSCDETAAALIDGAGNILSDVVASQIDFHARFGGVVPEIASRKHIEAICGVCDQALEDAGALRFKDLDAIAVTYAPGLVGALVVGVAFAKGAAWAADIPFIGVNHLEGHLYANKLAEGFEPPAVVSLVSGGNTMLVHMKDWGIYEILGATIDDAVGEAFDKVAKALGLPYPGGPHISRLAQQGNANAIDFPRALLHSGDLRFSLSGLKTAVTQYINAQREAGIPLNVPDICASFQAAVIDVQVAKARTALRQTHAPTFCLGGGVAANPELRHAYEHMCAEENIHLVMPPLSACGDNAAMIALVALDRFKQKRFFGLDHDAQAHADLNEPY